MNLCPQLPPHGSISRYRNHKCRCPLCKQTHREYTARNREDRLQRGALSHGTRSAYDAGCRCDDCRRARREAYLRCPSEYQPKSPRLGTDT